MILLLPTATYRARDFLAAARVLRIDVVIASEHAQALADEMGDRALVVPLHDPTAAASVLVAAAEAQPVDAIVAVDEPGVFSAALAADRLGLAHNSPAAVAATRDKASLRRRWAEAAVPQPRFVVARPGEDVAEAARVVGLPCVVKPGSLSGSRGVIRADSPDEAVEAAARIRGILERAATDDDAGPPPDPSGPLLVEEFVDGAEVALEGILRSGVLEVLAVFDKPDPMSGPYFAETLLVTPSRLPAAALEELTREAARAASALGLTEGPVHAEARVTPDGVRMLEIGARSIGGLCSRALTFGTGISLEQVILAHAAGLAIGSLESGPAAAGVLMLYAPAPGRLVAVEGIEDAREVPGVVDIEITARPGARVAPLPESARYLGFVFARSETPAEVEQALRRAGAAISMVVDEE